MAVTLSATVLEQYNRVTLYNSPYVAHDSGRAVDLYPGTTAEPDPRDGDPVPAPSPVEGEVRAVRTVAAPSRPYAPPNDTLILVETETHIARILHVDPAVQPGDRVAIGDSLGTLIRAGFFAPWVANHLHLEFRAPDADPYRATGSAPLVVSPDIELEPLEWDGTGTVVAAGETYAVLDAPTHGGGFAGLAATNASGARIGILDGGLPHYDGGGLLRRPTHGGEASVRGIDDPNGNGPTSDARPLHLLGTRVGEATDRDVSWADLTVLANEHPVTGIALGIGRDRRGVKLVGEALDLPVGTTVEVRLVGRA